MDGYMDGYIEGHLYELKCQKANMNRCCQIKQNGEYDRSLKDREVEAMVPHGVG